MLVMKATYDGRVFKGSFVMPMNSCSLAVPAAILFPVFAQAREKARQASCQSNLKQLGIAATNFATGKKGELPPVVGVPTGATINGASIYFVATCAHGFAPGFGFTALPSAGFPKASSRGTKSGVSAYVFVNGPLLLTTPPSAMQGRFSR